MNTTGKIWALALAAGEGTRLHSLTTSADGIAVPKQFCSLQGGQSLLHETLLRAETVVAREQVCTIVATQHQHWWSPICRSLPHDNVIVQPQNRGTANGILLSLLHILTRDPDARIIMLPSDHHVRNETVLTDSLESAISQLRNRHSGMVLMGITPDDADPELGYIVPGSRTGDWLSRVDRFVEKPSAAIAESLIEDGALWNTFIMVAHGQALLRLFINQFPQLVADMQAVVAHDEANPVDATAAAHLYRTLPTLDFSRDVLQKEVSALHVLQVPHCGWNDLGTPQRVAQTLHRLPRTQWFGERPMMPFNNLLNLAEQHAKLQVGNSMMA